MGKMKAAGITVPEQLEVFDPDSKGKTFIKVVELIKLSKRNRKLNRAKRGMAGNASAK